MIIKFNDYLKESLSEWFGNSKIVDNAGNPLIVYHGTNNKFDEFKITNDIGFHFGTFEQAKNVANIKGGNIIISAYLKIENPLHLPDIGFWYYLKPVLNILIKKNIISEDESKNIQKLKCSEGDKLKKVVKLLKDKGYDGIIYENETEEGEGTSYIVFDSNQIKIIK